MNKKYKCKFVRKDKSRLMKTVGWILGLLKIMSKSKFINHFITTVRRKIFFPKSSLVYTINANTNNQNASLLGLICHEFTHVIQKLGVDYLYDSTKLTKAETDATIAQMEFLWAIAGRMPTATDCAQALKDYDVSNKHIKSAYVKYEMATKMITQGLYRSKIAKEMITFIKTY